ncbi:MAG TPA: hypothetical protein PLO89_03280 [Spirochaetota bacterium]|nr:hypothetical protein [Spirochaetota bacterium]
MLKKILHILTRPKFFITLLSYYILFLGIKVVFHFSLLNRFTIILIPLTITLIYLVWNLFYYENLSDEMYDDEIREKFFNKIRQSDRKNIENLISVREEIQKLAGKTNLNPTKQSLVNDLTSFNLNDMIEKYAINSIKIKFILDFITKKGLKSPNLKEKILKLTQAKEKYQNLNVEIQNAFDEIQAQTVLILTDDSLTSSDSGETLTDIRKKIEIIDNTNNDINNFYTSISKDKELE